MRVTRIEDAPNKGTPGMLGCGGNADPAKNLEMQKLKILFKVYAMMKIELALALGISRQMVYKLTKQGMPCGSLKVARQWREEHLNPMRTVEYLTKIRAIRKALKRPTQ